MAIAITINDRQFSLVPRLNWSWADVRDVLERPFTAAVAHVSGALRSSSSARVSRSARQSRATVSAAAPRIALATQAQTVSALVSAHAGRAERVRRLQQDAARKLDAADYALSRLWDDVADIMAPPQRPTPARIHPPLPRRVAAQVPHAAAA